MIFRTDLALERKEYAQKEKLDGVREDKEEKNGITITRITVENEKGEVIKTMKIFKMRKELLLYGGKNFSLLDARTVSGNGY